MFKGTLARKFQHLSTWTWTPTAMCAREQHSD